MTEPQEPEYIDAELVDGPAPSIRSSSDKPKLLGPFAGLQLTDDEQGRSFLTEFERMGLIPLVEPLFSQSSDATQITATADTSYATHGPSQADRLSQLLYDIAKIVEAVNVATEPGDLVPADAGYTLSERMEQIITMIAAAPLTQQYATRLASGT